MTVAELVKALQGMDQGLPVVVCKWKDDDYYHAPIVSVTVEPRHDDRDLSVVVICRSFIGSAL